VLVRDDFGGYVGYDTDLAGVQQCLAHLLGYLDDAHAIDTDAQAWPPSFTGVEVSGRHAGA
jgi:hypothetical protein